MDLHVLVRYHSSGSAEASFKMHFPWEREKNIHMQNKEKK